MSFLRPFYFRLSLPLSLSLSSELNSQLERKQERMKRARLTLLPVLPMELSMEKAEAVELKETLLSLSLSLFSFIKEKGDDVDRLGDSYQGKAQRSKWTQHRMI